MTRSSSRPAALLVSENEWKATVLATLRQFRWSYVHARPARTKHGWRTAFEGAPGFPDLTAWRERVIYAELKREDGKPEPDQVERLRELANAGAEVYVWRPSDFEAMVAVLRARRPGLAVWEEAPS